MEKMLNARLQNFLDKKYKNKNSERINNVIIISK